MSSLEIQGFDEWVQLINGAIKDTVKYKWFLDLSKEAISTDPDYWLEMHKVWGENPNAKKTYMQYTTMQRFKEILSTDQNGEGAQRVKNACNHVDNELVRRNAQKQVNDVKSYSYQDIKNYPLQLITRSKLGAEIINCSNPTVKNFLMEARSILDDDYKCINFLANNENLKGQKSYDGCMYDLINRLAKEQKPVKPYSERLMEKERAEYIKSLEKETKPKKPEVEAVKAPEPVKPQSIFNENFKRAVNGLNPNPELDEVQKKQQEKEAKQAAEDAAKLEVLNYDINAITTKAVLKTFRAAETSQPIKDYLGEVLDIISNELERNTYLFNHASDENQDTYEGKVYALVKQIHDNEKTKTVDEVPQFEVTPDNIEEPEQEPVDVQEVSKNVKINTDFLIKLEQYKQAAINDQYPYEQVESAAEVATEKNCSDYDSFVDLINNQFKLEQERERKEKERLEQKSAQIRVGLDRLRQVQDIGNYANGEIIKVYSTSAVTLMDIMHYATDENLHLDLYENATYSIILQMRTKWVQDIINRVLKAWVTEEYPRNYVKTYIEQSGRSSGNFDQDCDALISLGTNNVMRYKNDPKIYLAFIAVQQLLRSNNVDENAYRDQVMSNSKKMINYISILESDMEDGMPIKVAEVHASEYTETYDEYEHEEPTGEGDDSRNILVAAAGGIAKLQGNYIRMKYDMAKAKEDMLKESLGDNYEEYKANQAIIQQRKDEIKAQKEEYKYQQKLRKEENKMHLDEMRQEAELRAEERRIEERAMEREDMRFARRNGYNQGNGNTYVNNGYGPGYNHGYGPGYGPNNMSAIGAKIPPILIAIVADVFLALIGGLLTSKGTMIFLIASLGLSVLGFVKLKHKEQGAIFVIAGGYLLYFIVLFFAISMK